MTFIFSDLDPTTREHMLNEFTDDLHGTGLYISPRLSAAGIARYPAALEAAIVGGDADSLGPDLATVGTFNAMESYSKGVRKVRSDAPQMLAEGEFNRYYVRGLCARVLAEGGGEVEVYRGRESGFHRPGSDALIGQRLDARALLEDLRANALTPENISVLPDVNSGITVKAA